MSATAAVVPLRQSRPLAEPGDFRPPSLAEQVANDFIWSFYNPNTRTNYVQGLRRWFRFCERVGIDPLTGLDGAGVRRSDVERFLRFSEEAEGLARRTVAGSYSALKGYFRRALGDGVIEKDPCAFVKAPPVERRTTTNDLTASQLARILKLADGRSPRDFAIFSLLGYNGLRASELVGLDVGDVSSSGPWTKITVLRKGGKTQTLTLSAPTGYAINLHIGDRTSGPLFCSKRTPDKRISRGDLQGLVKRYAKWAGIVQRVSPHSFRHTFITQSRNARVPDREIQIAAGHADMRMLAYYDHGHSNEGREATHLLTAYIAEMMD